MNLSGQTCNPSQQSPSWRADPATALTTATPAVRPPPGAFLKEAGVPEISQVNFSSTAAALAQSLSCQEFTGKGLGMLLSKPSLS